MQRALVVVVALALALGGCWFSGHRQSAAATTQYLTTSVRQGHVTSSIASTRTIDAANTYSLAFGTTTESTTSRAGSSASNGSTSSSSSTKQLQADQAQLAVDEMAA